MRDRGGGTRSDAGGRTASRGLARDPGSSVPPGGAAPALVVRNAAREDGAGGGNTVLSGGLASITAVFEASRAAWAILGENTVVALLAACVAFGGGAAGVMPIPAAAVAYVTSRLFQLGNVLKLLK